MLGRIALALSVAVFAAPAGFLAGWLSVRPGDGPVGGAKLGFGLIAGGGIGLLLGAVFAWRLPAASRRRGLIVGGPAALICLAVAGGAVVWGMAARNAAETAALAGGPALPTVSVELTRGPGADPVLARRIRVDTGSGTWETALPDGRVCRGGLSATARARLAAPLAGALRAPPVPERCRQGAADGETLALEWPEGATGLDLSAECRADHPGFDGLAVVMALVPARAETRVSCEAARTGE